MSQERLIKKYANRRLYDASQSRHITLDDIRGLIVKGEKIRVVEDKTGQDITRHILLQVIAEQEQGGRPILTADMLKQIIRFYGNPLQELMAGYLERSVQLFLTQQKTLQDQIQKTFAMGPLNPLGMPPLGGLQDLATKNLEAWSQMQKSFLDMLAPRPGSGAAGADREPPGHGKDKDHGKDKE